MAKVKNKSAARKFSKIALARPDSRLARLAGEEKKIGKELEAIYRNGDGSMPDMADFDGRPKRSLARALLVLFFACVFLAGTAYAVFFIFSPGSRFEESDVVLEIAGDSEAKAGALVHYRLRYRNNQNVPLTKANLSARFPAGFIFKEASQPAADDKNNSWDIGAIDPNQGGYLDIYGYLYGDLGEEESLRVFLNYYPSNFNSEFQKVATFNSKITSSPVVFTVERPAEIVAGSEAEFTVSLAKPEEPVKNLAVTFEPGGNFNKTMSEPASDADNIYKWSLPEVADEQKIKLRGTFNPEEAKVTVKFRLLGWADERRADDGYVWQEEVMELPVIKTELSASLAINGALTDFAVSPGETLNTSIVLKNAGDTAVKNVQARLVFETPSYNNKSMLDWQELNDPADGDVTGEQLNDGTRRGFVSWTKKHLPALNKLEPGKAVNIDLYIPFKDGKDADLTQFTGASASALLEVKYENGEGEKVISSAPIKMTINSDLSFEARDEVVSYNNQEMHRVSWILTNSFHELKNIELKADIYNIDWLPEEAQTVPAGKLEWDKGNSEVVWKIEFMPTTVDVLALQFGLVLKAKNPSQTNLTSKVSIKATDAITSQEIMLAGDEILLTRESD